MRKADEAGFRETCVERESAHELDIEGAGGIQFDTWFRFGGGILHGNQTGSFLRI